MSNDVAFLARFYLLQLSSNDTHIALINFSKHYKIMHVSRTWDSAISHFNTHKQASKIEDKRSPLKSLWVLWKLRRMQIDARF